MASDIFVVNIFKYIPGWLSVKDIKLLLKGKEFASYFPKWLCGLYENIWCVNAIFNFNTGTIINNKHIGHQYSQWNKLLQLLIM